MKAKKTLLALLVLFGFKLMAQPTTQAPIPTQSSTDVISVFSDSYTNLSGTDFFPNWGQGTIVSDFSVSGNGTKVYQNLDYQGTQFASPINASSMEMLHVDIWTSNGATFDFYLVNTATSQEQAYRLTPTQGGWNSYDIPLTSYAAGIVSNIGQFKFVDEPMQYQASTRTYYLDNIYFWKSANTPTISGFSFPVKFTTDAPFTITPPTSNSLGAFSYSSSNASVATVSGNTITIVGAGTTIITANQAADGSFGPGSTTAVLLVTFAPPSTNPSAPTHNSSNVVSLFSDSYTNVSGINWFPNWGQSTTHLDLTNSGNTIKRYDNINYQGVEFASPLDVSTMEMLHFDLWTPNCNALQFFLINLSPFAEQQITVNPTLSGWNSFDIPLSSYTSINKANIGQIKLVSTPFGGPTIYLDNVYFWKSAGSPTITGFNVPTKFLGDAPFSLTAPTSNSTGAFTYTSSNPSVATISGSTVTIVGVGSTTITANQASDATYNAGSTSTILNVRYPAPITAAPIPTHSSSIVKSLYSDSYTNESGIDWYPNWGQSTLVSDISIAGNTTKRYDNLNYQGVQFASGVDASAYNHLHIDLYTPNCTSFELFLINTPGGEQSVTLTPTLNGWNSFDIPLTSYNAINLSNIGQLKLVGTPFGSSAVFLDNIYFWNAVTPTLGSFSVTAKELGDAPFALTAPTSNSNGAFSYTSSNTGVATVSGNTVTIVGVGTSTITAIQAASGSFGSASTSATLVVSLPALPTAPSVAAPTPTQHPFNVISLYSNAYTNRPIDTWSAVWDMADIDDTTVVGNDTKKYSNLVFSGVEFTSNTINATNAEYFHIDVWTPNTNVFRIKLVDFGANGTFGGGDDKEHELTFTAPTLSNWTSYDIPMSAFTGLTTKANLAQMIVVSNGATVYFDNVYFWANSCLNPVTNPSVSLISDVNNVCPGTAITFSATPTNGGMNPNYDFKVNNISVQNGSMSTYSSNSLLNNDVVTCDITRTDGCANTGVSNSVVAIIKNAPSAATFNSPNINSLTMCKVGNTVAIYPSISGGVWSNSNSNVVSLTGTSSTARYANALANGTSTLSYTIISQVNGCSATSTISVNVAEAEMPASVTGSNSMCVNSATQFTTASTGGVWSTAGRGSINSSGLFTPTSAGASTIRYTVTNTSGCSSTSSLNITINALPSTPNIAYASGSANPQSGCLAGTFGRNRTFSLVGFPSGGTWSASGQVSITPLGVATTSSSNGAASVSYTVTNANGCSNSRTISAIVANCGSRGAQSNESIKLTVFPNPAKNVLNVNINSVTAESRLAITDISGKQLLVQQLSIGNNKIDISKFAKGFYVVSLLNNDEVKSQKLIIE